MYSDQFCRGTRLINHVQFSCSASFPPRAFILQELDSTCVFCSADDDHDEKLTIDEIVSKHDVFVGSEATDYGDHLHRAKIIDEL